MADMTTPFEELLLAPPAPPVTPPRPVREPPVCPDAPVRQPLPSSDDEEEEASVTEEEEDGEEVPPPEAEAADADAEAEADPDNTYIPVIRLTRQIDVSEMLAAAQAFLATDFQIIVSGKGLLAVFVALIAFLMLVVARTC